jgi:monofunctional glycosyltransferase
MVKRLAIIVLAILALWLVFEWIRFPDVREYADEAPETTAFMEQRKKELARDGEDRTIDYRFVSYERISSNFRRAVLVSEDNAFWDHEGVDVEGFKEAMKRNWEEKSLGAGGSTITQQLAKNLYLSPSRNPLRKLREYFIARALEKHLSKKRILELYLNVVELGERVYGAEAAARHYFGKSAASLSPREAALLAGALPNPRVMKPDDPNGRLRARRDIILSRMKRWGHLAEEEVLRAPEPEKVEEELPPVEETETDTATETIDPVRIEPREPPAEDPPATSTTEEPSPPADDPPTSPAPAPPPAEAPPPADAPPGW